MRGPLPKDASHNPSDDSDFNFSDEEEIFSSYRDTRFAQFNEECQRNETMLESQRDSARRFEYKKLIWSENVAELDRKNYVKHVEASGHGKFGVINWTRGVNRKVLLVITLLYDAFDEHSIVTNKAINQLAKELPHVKFCRAEHKVILDSCSDLLSSFQNHPFPYYNCPFGLPFDSFWTLLGLLLDSFWTLFGLLYDSIKIVDFRIIF